MGVDMVTAAVALLLILAFITDMKSQTIPNRLTVSFFAAGCLFHTISEGLPGALGALWGAAAGFLPLLPVYFAGGIGAGDVKLFGAVGAWTSAGIVLQLMMYAILYAGAIGLCLILLNRRFARNMVSAIAAAVIPGAGWKKRGWLQWSHAGHSFPFMLAVAPAGVTLWLAC